MENIPDYSTTASEFKYMKHIIHGPLRKSFSAVKCHHYTHEERIIKTPFLKLILKH